MTYLEICIGIVQVCSLIYINHFIVAVKHPPALCYKIPGLGKYARACLELYDINLGAKSLCARVKGVIDLKVSGLPL